MFINKLNSIKKLKIEILFIYKKKFTIDNYFVFK